MFRPRFFSTAEWRYHLLMMPLLFPIGNYYFIGMDYFQNPSIFLIGTGVVFCLYWFSILLLTVAVRKVLDLIPEPFIFKRIALMLLVVGILTTLLAIFDVWIYSIVAALNVAFSWAKVQPIWLLGFVFDIFICAALSLFYNYSKWKEEQQRIASAFPVVSPSPALSERIVPNYQGWWSGVSPLEWGFHGLALLVFVPLANYLFIGPHYWNDRVLLTLGSAIVAMLYLPCAVLLTLSVRLAICTFPQLRQTLYRILLMLALTGMVSAIAPIGAFWIMSQIDVLSVTYQPDTIKGIILLGFCFDFLLCLTHGYFYALSMWQKEQVESEALKNEALQRRYDTLKGQVNPHFLFNCLTSLSSLIQEDLGLAEKFVDELSKVYRYLLQANQNTLVSLEKEITFINSYVFLLKIRYANGISVTIDADINEKTGYLPPLTLQLLLENAMKNNTISAKKPLNIQIQTTEAGQLMLTHNLQKRTVSIPSNQSDLSNLVGKYKFLTKQPVSMYDDGEKFRVLLPLLPNVMVTEVK